MKLKLKPVVIFSLLCVSLWAKNVLPDDPQWEVVSADPGVFRRADGLVTLDVRNSRRDAVIKTHDFPVRKLQNYRFEAQVRRLSGDMPFSLNLLWIGEAGENLGIEYNLMGKLFGRAWEPYVVEAIAPEKAVRARVVISLRSGWGAEFKDFRLLETVPVGLRVAADLYAAQAKKEQWPLIVRIENRGDAVLQSGEARISLPAGVSAAQSLSFPVGRLAYQGVFHRELTLSGIPDDPDGKLTCDIIGEVEGKPVNVVSTTKVFSTVAKESAVNSAALPMPVLPKSGIQLGCYYFPVMVDWDRNNWGVRSVGYLEPLLGYYDEARPEVADWHIYWAVTHGIQYFVFDWYWNQGMDFLNDALEKGFLKSRFKNQMKFCIDWCAEGHCAQFKMEDLSAPAMLDFTKILCERYFVHSNYLTVDGKPVVFFHTPTKLITEHGGWEGCREVLDKMRGLARSHGHQGIYFVAVQNGTPFLLDFQKGGFDATAPYAYGFRDVAKTKDERGLMLSYEAAIPRHVESFSRAQREAHARGLDYIPSAWAGWDDYARSRYTSVRTPGNTPAAFRQMLEVLPQYVEPTHKLALIEAWNEWGEGGAIEPGIQYRFAHLSAVRDTLTDARGPYEIFVPTAEEVARYDTPITHDEVYEIYEKRYGAQFKFSQGLILDFAQDRQSLYLRPVGAVRNLTIEKGAESADLLAPDSGFASPPCLNLPASAVAGLKIRMKLTAGSSARLDWITDEKPNWPEAFSRQFPVKADGKFHEYTIMLSGDPGWHGVIRQFRLYPSEQISAVEIDDLRTF